MFIQILPLRLILIASLKPLKKHRCSFLCENCMYVSFLSQWICIFQQHPKSLCTPCFPPNHEKVWSAFSKLSHLPTPQMGVCKLLANHHFLLPGQSLKWKEQAGQWDFSTQTRFRRDVREVAFWCVSESVRRASARRMYRSRPDSSIIKLPSQSSITQQGSCWPWRCRRWAGAQTHKHQYTNNNMARDHFAITPLGYFQLSLEDLFQLFNQTELIGVTWKHNGRNHLISARELHTGWK